jgi:hypothetical protein
MRRIGLAVVLTAVSGFEVQEEEPQALRRLGQEEALQEEEAEVSSLRTG